MRGIYWLNCKKTEVPVCHSERSEESPAVWWSYIRLRELYCRAVIFALQVVLPYGSCGICDAFDRREGTETLPYGFCMGRRPRRPAEKSYK